jgi:spore coat polysaccharide biosynthesis protein SpsF (cytidylyltransferase family)
LNSLKTDQPKVVLIIQARLSSSRFPRKVLEKVKGKSLIARVCAAARASRYADKVVVVWAHKFPHLDENNVLGRFQEVVKREDAKVVVRLTSDCPLLTGPIIDWAIEKYFERGLRYYYNHWDGYIDGFDVQVIDARLLFMPYWTDTEHVIHPPTKLSVDTPEDLERVRNHARG